MIKTKSKLEKNVENMQRFTVFDSSITYTIMI